MHPTRIILPPPLLNIIRPHLPVDVISIILGHLGVGVVHVIVNPEGYSQDSGDQNDGCNEGHHYANDAGCAATG